jgi:hypothetical protein
VTASPRILALAPAAALIILLAACTGVDSSVSPSSVNASGTAGPSASQLASANPTIVPTPAPTDSIGEFACSLPVTGVGTVVRAQITDIRIGTHDGYDRVVFEFDNRIPEFRLEEATPPLFQDPSGLEMEVEGNAFLRLVMQGGTAISPDGVKTYSGPTNFTPDFPKLAELASAGDFEAVSSWYIGLSEASCVRVLTLSDPSRLVIDLEQ